MSNIHNYPLEAFQINDEDFYDVDYWNGVTYESRKISGATLKSVLSGAEQLNDLTDVTTGLPVSPTNSDDGRVLYFDVTTGQWISDDIANISNVVKDCKTSALTGSIPKGTAVYLAGYDNDLLVVEPCDSTDPNKMPCIGVTAEVLDDTNPKKVVSFGKIQGLDTSGFSDGDILYVGTGGGFTTTRPTGASEIQRVATVLKSAVNGGQLKVYNTSRTAGLPNLSTDSVWIGDVDGYPIEVLITSLLENIYNADGSMSGNRFVSLNGFILDISDLAGSTQMTGGNILSISANSGQEALLKLSAGNGEKRGLEFNNQGDPRWQIVVDTLETGGNAGSDFQIYRFDDAGLLIDVAVKIDRATGEINILGQYSLPVLDGNAGDVMTTDGLGNVTFQPAASGGSETHVDTFYAFDMSQAAAYTWNGITNIGATALVTLSESTRFQLFSGTGTPDGCFVNTLLPSYYVNGSDIVVTCLFSTNGGGGNVRFFVGIQTPSLLGLFGNDADTTWTSYTFQALNGFPIQKAILTFNGAALNLQPNDPIVVKIYRDPANAGDTYNGDAYINTLGIQIG